MSGAMQILAKVSGKVVGQSKNKKGAVSGGFIGRGAAKFDGKSSPERGSNILAEITMFAGRTDR